MGMAAVLYKKGAPDNFVWEEIEVGAPGPGQVRLRSTAVGVNFADTYHRAGISHPMIVGDEYLNFFHFETPPCPIREYEARSWCRALSLNRSWPRRRPIAPVPECL